MINCDAAALPPTGTPTGENVRMIMTSPTNPTLSIHLTPMRTWSVQPSARRFHSAYRGGLFFHEDQIIPLRHVVAEPKGSSWLTGGMLPIADGLEKCDRRLDAGEWEGDRPFRQAHCASLARKSHLTIHRQPLAIGRRTLLSRWILEGSGQPPSAEGSGPPFHSGIRCASRTPGRPAWSHVLVECKGGRSKRWRCAASTESNH